MGFSGGHKAAGDRGQLGVPKFGGQYVKQRAGSVGVQSDAFRHGHGASCRGQNHTCNRFEPVQDCGPGVYSAVSEKLHHEQQGKAFEGAKAFHEGFGPAGQPCLCRFCSHGACLLQTVDTGAGY